MHDVSFKDFQCSGYASARATARAHSQAPCPWNCRMLTTFGWEGLPWWPGWQRVCLQCGRPGFDPWVWKIPRRREWLPTPVFLPGKLHGQRNLSGYRSWGHKESSTTEWLTLFFQPSEPSWGTMGLPFSWPLGIVSSIALIHNHIICIIHMWNLLYHVN